jgi:farnesyl diphosphate synthase
VTLRLQPGDHRHDHRAVVEKSGFGLAQERQEVLGDDRGTAKLAEALDDLFLPRDPGRALGEVPVDGGEIPLFALEPGHGHELSRTKPARELQVAARGRPPWRGLSARASGFYSRAMTNSRDEDFQRRLEAHAGALEAVLDGLLAFAAGEGEIARPARLVEAMRYAVLGGGKRVRPFLLIETARLFGREPAGGVLRAAAALELVHCYSLAHDDLPAMDDDDLRRGRPSLHRAFDEATAILAGDGLLTLAFEILADAATDHEAEVRASLVAGLARAAGPGGMVGGQVLDIGGTGERETMLRMKTAALFRFAAEAGAILGRAEPEARARAASFGEVLGIAFQLADDIADRDANASPAALARRGEEARGLLAPFGSEAEVLRALVGFVEGAVSSP